MISFHSAFRKATVAVTSVVLLFSGLSASAQKSKAQLEKERQKKLQEISVTKKILEQTKSRKEESSAVLAALNKQVNTRAEIIQNLLTQLDLVSVEMSEKDAEIKVLGEELKSMRSNFSNLVYSGYKTRNSINRISFVFSSNSFNQAVMRMSYLRRITVHLKKEFTLIQGKQLEASEKYSELLSIKNEKSLLLDKQERQKQQLERDKKTKESLVKTLERKEDDLRKQLAAQERAAKKLDEAIKKAIEAEIRKAKEEEARRRKAEEEARKKTESTETKEGGVVKKDLSVKDNNYMLTGKFEQNRAKLPWPVSKGFVSERFGKHPHPTLKDVSTFNNGINITTTEGSMANAIFEGTVAAVVQVPGLNQSILVKHGEYFTVYANLVDLRVKQGDAIKAGTPLGMVFTDASGETLLHFELWKGYEKQNPEIWIKK